MIEARDLMRRYGDFTAVAGVTFSVADGEILGILGPNGAGKTTTLRMITGFLPPSAGRVTVNGHDLQDDPIPARGEIGYLPENVALYPEMRVSEYLAYRARLQGMGRSTGRAAIAEALERCLLEVVEHQIIGTLSKGYRQRVGLAAAILHRPPVLVLDEPTVGLDPKQIIAIRELIRELGAERTLLLSSHILPEVEQLCQRVLIIDQGRLVADGTPSELRRLAEGRSRLRLEIEHAPSEAAERLAQIPGIVEVEPFEASAPSGNEPVTALFSLLCAPDTDPRREVFQTAVEQGWVLLELSERKVSLEDVFVRLTTHAPEIADAAAPETDETDETEEPRIAGEPRDDAKDDAKDDAEEARA